MPSATRPHLIATHAAVIDATTATDGASPIWIQLIPAGSFAGRDGRGPYNAGDEAAMRTVVDASRKRAAATDIVVDYDHQTVFSAIPGVGGRAPAAGWIKELEARPDGIYGRIEWTDAATQAIRAGEYRYISPVYRHDKSGHVRVLISAALTNTPNLDLTAVAASALIAPPGDTMEPIAEALGLAADADEAACLTAIRALTAAHAAVITAAGLATGATTDAVVAAVQSARSSAVVDPTKFVPVEQFTAVQSQLTALQAASTDGRVTAAVEKLISEGRLVPASRDWAISYARADFAGFAAMSATLPIVVTPGGRKEAGGTPAPSDAALSEADQVVMSAMGISPEAFTAARKKEAL